MNRSMKSYAKVLAAAIAPVCGLSATTAFGASIGASVAAPTGNVEIQQLTYQNDSDLVWTSVVHQAFGQTFTVGAGFTLDAVSFIVQQENDPPDRSTAGHTMRVQVYNVGSLLDADGSTGNTLVVNETGVTPAFGYGVDTWLRFDVANTALPAGTYGMSIDFDFLLNGSGGFPGGHRIGGSGAGIRYNSNEVYAGGAGFRSPGGAFSGDNDLAFVIQSIPEPTSLSMLGLGAASLMRRRETGEGHH
jgi:hypothetical protein